ncbi:hypothetical protein [Algoriphagus vanfongensis]|uniref:hypothetical protein n=1 Tax=Algoriphagus vanfongensis TaxID=426371 RepID=UPI00041FA000|nr:hypothetical protein [Algoriphagus vanfongensis]
MLKDSPQSIIILNDLDHRSLKYNPSFTGDDKNEFLSIERMPGKMKFPGGVEVNQTYILHPFSPNSYYPISFDRDKIQRMKMQKFSQLAGHLGAKSFQSKISSYKKFGFKINGNAKIETFKFSAGENAGAEFTFEREKKYKLKNTYSEIDTPAFNKAIDYARQTGLDKDEEMMDFVNSRNPENPSLLTSQTISTSLSTELNFAITYAAHLNAMVKKLNLGTNIGLDANVFFLEHIDLDIKIQF